jgi:2-(1,2-epoxy-1,2-dihydrophenyl)acetyl-CoA isomerase
MLFLNRTLKAQEAFQYGLVNEVFKSEEFIDEVKKVTEQLSQGPPMAFLFTKKLLNESFTNTLNSHLDREAEEIVKTARTEDFQEGLKAFFEKRIAKFLGK